MTDFTPITAEIAAAAKQRDMAACAIVISVTEAMVSGEARKAATKCGRTDLLEDLEGAGRLAVWEAVETFAGRSKFTTYVFKAIQVAVDEEIHKLDCSGVGRSSMKTFKHFVALADGDLHAAEKLAVVAPTPLRPDTALACRLALQGSHSLDYASDDDDSTLADTITDPGEPLDAADFNKEQRRKSKALAHALLALVSERQRFVCHAWYGIDPVGVTMGAVEIATELGVTRSTVDNTYSQAIKRMQAKGEALMAGEGA